MDNRRHQHFSDLEYLPGRTAADYLSECQAKHPDLYARLKNGRSSQDHWKMVREIISHYTEHLVDDDAMGGATGSYKGIPG